MRLGQPSGAHGGHEGDEKNMFMTRIWSAETICALVVIGIRHLYHKNMRIFGKSEKRRRTCVFGFGVALSKGKRKVDFGREDKGHQHFECFFTVL
jgi:hypothetical protein